jgi:hypothetical protein
MFDRKHWGHSQFNHHIGLWLWTLTLNVSQFGLLPKSLANSQITLKVGQSHLPTREWLWSLLANSRTTKIKCPENCGQSHIGSQKAWPTLNYFPKTLRMTFNVGQRHVPTREWLWTLAKDTCQLANDFERCPLANDFEHWPTTFANSRMTQITHVVGYKWQWLWTANRVHGSHQSEIAPPQYQAKKPSTSRLWDFGRWLWTFANSRMTKIEFPHRALTLDVGIWLWLMAKDSCQLAND